MMAKEFIMKGLFGNAALASVAGIVLLGGVLAVAAEKEKGTVSANQPAKEEARTATEVTYLGVAVEPLHPAFWAHLQGVLEHSQGLMVEQVTKDSPAEKAGVKPHDILFSYGDQKLFSPTQLMALVQEDKVGHDVKLGIVRDGKSQEITVKLGQHVAQIAPTATRPTWHMPRWFARRGRAESAVREPAWTSFDSLTLKNLGNNRYSVEIGYETQGGKIEHRMFEGTRDEIRQDIMSQKDLPANERDRLLRSVDVSSDELQIGFPEVYFTPDGRLIWDFQGTDNGLWSMPESEF
jgi:membrane-associated protease RseP (regulator of RpoE activity)